MILWAIAICATAGFLLGTQCRLLLLAVASAVVAAALPLVLRAGDAAPETALVSGPLGPLGPFGTLGLLAMLLVVLQGFFLAGAVMGASGRVSRSAGASLASRPASRTSGS
jgi:hypothetical protein